MRDLCLSCVFVPYLSQLIFNLLHLSVFHLHVRERLRAAALLHHHHHQEVLHRVGLRRHLRQRALTEAVGRSRVRLRRCV